MHYFALLRSPERDLTADEGAEEMAAYQQFHARAAAAIRGGDALTAAAAGARITGGPDHPTVTDGPFAEGAEIAGGYYVFEADNLDEALELARHIPAARYACVEVWPMVHWGAPTEPVGNGWLALLLEPAEAVMTPGSAQWEEGLRQHGEFAKAAGDHILGGAPLHPPGTATTVTVRDGQTVFTDGPYVEGAEVRHAYLRRRIKECEIS